MTLLFLSLLSGNYKTSNMGVSNFIETEPYEKNFSNYYSKNISKLSEDYNNQRLVFLDQARRNLFISLGLIFVLIFILFFFVKEQVFGVESFDIAASIIFFSGSGLYWWVKKPIRNYKTSVKSGVYSKIISFYDGFTFSEECNANMDKINDSSIVPSYDRVSLEDEINGTYNNVSINMFEMNLKQRRRSKNTTTYVTIFNGVAINLSLNKKFNGKTIVKKDMGKIGNWVTDKFNKLENVKLEDPTFESIFETYSSDQIEARFLLTTSFMQRLLDLKDALNGTNIQCSFYDDKLFIMIALKENLFEPKKIYMPVDFARDSKIFLKEMNIIFQIINILKLDLNIGL